MEKMNIFNAIMSVVNSDIFAAPADLFSDLKKGPKTPIDANDLEKTMFVGLFEAIATTHNYSFIESYSARAAQEWEAICVACPEMKDRYSRFALLNAAVNAAIDAGKKMPEDGVVKFEAFVDKLTVYSDFAKRSGKLNAKGEFNKLLVECGEMENYTDPNSAMGILKDVLNENLPMELDVRADQNKRLAGVKDTLVNVVNVKSARDLCWDAIKSKDVVQLKNVNLDEYFLRVMFMCEAYNNNAHIKAVCEHEMREISEATLLQKKIGVKPMHIMFTMVKLYGAAIKDNIPGRNVAYSFMNDVLHTANPGATTKQLENTMDNLAANYLRSAADNWVDWHNGEYHKITSALYNLKDLVALFFNDWRDASNNEEVEALEENFSFNTEADCMSQEDFDALFE